MITRISKNPTILSKPQQNKTIPFYNNNGNIEFVNTLDRNIQMDAMASSSIPKYIGSIIMRKGQYRIKSNIGANHLDAITYLEFRRESNFELLIKITKPGLLKYSSFKYPLTITSETRVNLYLYNNNEKYTSFCKIINLENY